MIRWLKYEFSRFKQIDEYCDRRAESWRFESKISELNYLLMVKGSIIQNLQIGDMFLVSKLAIRLTLRRIWIISIIVMIVMMMIAAVTVAIVTTVATTAAATAATTTTATIANRTSTTQRCPRYFVTSVWRITFFYFFFKSKTII